MKGLFVCLLLPVGLAQAVRVYLSPPSPLPSKLSAKQASFALSRHLDLESFESIEEDSLVWDGPLHQEFVGQGPKDGLLLTIDESYVHGTSSRLLDMAMRIHVDLTYLCYRHHPEEFESGFRDPLNLLSDFARLTGLDILPPCALHLLPYLLRGVISRTWRPSITRHFLRTLRFHRDLHVRNLHSTGFRRIRFNFRPVWSVRAQGSWRDPAGLRER